MKELIRKLREKNAHLKKELDTKEWTSKKTRECVEILYKELEKKNEELKKIDKMKSSFVANVSHEFKNPLAIIKESLDLAITGEAGKLNSKQGKMLRIAKKTIERLIRLVTDLLDLSRIELGKLQLKKQKVNLLMLVKEILTVYEKDISKKEITLKKDLPRKIKPILADRDKLDEVIINLLNNAIKYTPTRGKIAVKVKDVKEEIHFEIFNTGPSIPKKYFHKIFDKFERIVFEREEGTGLGLSISKDIIELHGGKIWVESKKRKGNKFIFSLPFHPA